MGDLFEPDVSQEPTTSGYQQQVQALLGQEFPGLFRGVRGLMPRRKRALAEILEGAPTDIRGIEENAFRRFQRQVVPQITSGFANIGGTLSTRRGTTIGQQAGDLNAQLAALDVQMRESARNRQLAAAQQVLSERLAPFGLGGSFSTAGTMENIIQPSLGSGLLGVAGTLGGGYLGGPGFAKLKS
jgi:hypothetical protein